tara:strand:- start:773 stop:1423 length:651 start_codon:yes stop_codon:yes gene_type:complete
MGGKNVFWQALIFTIVIFGLGLMSGFFLENYRTSEVFYGLIDSELDILDDQIRERVVEEFDVDCDLAKKSSFDFADKIYGDALKLDAYNSASKFTDSLKILHKRYDLLRVLLWAESIDLKEKCGNDFNIIVYLYNYKTTNLDIKSKQMFYSRLLFDLKTAHPDDLMLIPLAVDTDLGSVNLIIENYKISEFPSIIINEDMILTDILTYDELENIVF